MTQRITMKQLEAVAARINRETNSPLEPYTRTADKFVSNVGNYHIDEGTGCYSFRRMSNEQGGVSSIFSARTKSELYDQMHAFLSGVYAGQK